MQISSGNASRCACTCRRTCSAQCGMETSPMGGGVCRPRPRRAPRARPRPRAQSLSVWCFAPCSPSQPRVARALPTMREHMIYRTRFPRRFPMFQIYAWTGLGGWARLVVVPMLGLGGGHAWLSCLSNCLVWATQGCGPRSRPTSGRRRSSLCGSVARSALQLTPARGGA